MSDLLGMVQMRDIRPGDTIRLVGFGEDTDGACKVVSIEAVEPVARIVTTVQFANGDTARVWHWTYSFVEPITTEEQHDASTT